MGPPPCPKRASPRRVPGALPAIADPGGLARLMASAAPRGRDAGCS